MEAEAGDIRLRWQRRLRPLLWPAARCYSGIQKARRYAYRRGLLRPVECGRPVVSVGSLLAGGSGKTPFVLHLAARLATATYRVAILSGGFGGRARKPGRVERGSDPQSCGDEPLLLARATPAAVWIGRNRADLARRLANDYDLFLLDDGYQHLRLSRAFNICLVPNQPVGDILPAGLWRERPSALVDADFVACVEDVPGWLCDFYAGPVGTVEFGPGEWHSGSEPATPPARVLAFCGIARPERFLATLAGFELRDTALFRDHHRYTAGDLDTLWARASRTGAEALVTTAKDAVRIRSAVEGLPLFWRDVSLRWNSREDEFARCLTDAVGAADHS